MPSATLSSTSTSFAAPFDRVVEAALTRAFRNSDSQYPNSIAYAHPARPLIALAKAGLNLRDFVAKLEDMPEETRRIAHRLGVLHKGPATKMLAARMTHETNDRAYLATGVNSFDFLVAVIFTEEYDEFPLRLILTDPSLSDEARITKILALRKDAADRISCIYAGGSNPGDKNRFYLGTLKGHNYDFGVIDRTNNEVLYSNPWATRCNDIAKAMNAHPEIAKRLCQRVAEYNAIALPQPHQEHLYARDHAALLAELDQATRK